MAALVMMTAACNNDDNEILTLEQPAKAKGITITAQLAPKTGGATTRAVADNGDNRITVTWAQNEHIAILYEVSSTPYVADATITAVDGSGTATITFTVEAGTANDTPCTLVYPLSAAKDDHTGVKDAATLLAAQDGTLNVNLDVREGEGTIQTTTPGLTVTTQPAAQYSIFKFTTQDISGSDITPTEFTVSDAAGNVITTVTLTTSDLYVALPVLSADTYWFNATASDKPYIAKATVSTATSAGNFYSTTVKMATVGDVILSDGKFAAKGTDGERAIITYVGSDNCEASPYNHGLAFAMSDAGGGGNIPWGSSSVIDAGHTKQPSSTFTIESGLQYNDATHNSDNYRAFKAAMANNDTAAPTGCSDWFLASGYQWTKMIAGAGSASNLRSLVGLQANYYYWTSSEINAQKAWQYDFKKWRWLQCTKTDSQNRVRACLAF